jgi:2-hydroxy-3-oxopropionate reductase
MTHKIAFLGTGLMGGPMARNLLQAGFAVTVWNRTRAKADVLAEFGATIVPEAINAVAGADIVVTMLSDGPAVGALLFGEGVARAMKAGAIVIDMSSIKPAEAREHALALQALSVAHLDAPVSGGTKGAEGATLAIMAGGEPDVFERVKPVLAAMGRPVLVGPSGCGQLAKLANQGIVAITIGAVAEAMLLMQRGGADMNGLRDALKGGFADSIILQQHGKRMADEDFVPGGRSAFQLKDLNNLVQEAQNLGLTLPLSQMQQSRFHHLVHSLDGADLDHSALFLQLVSENR